MPAEDTVTRPRQKDSLDELLANFEFARIKEYVEKRSREAAKVHVTVKPVGTVQHCSPCSPNLDRPSGVYFNLKNNEGEMGPELEELKSPSAGTSLETPEQQCPPKEGTWGQVRTNTSGILTAGLGSKHEGRISAATERAKDTTTIADISSNTATPSKRRHKASSEENKQFDPGRELGGYLLVLRAVCTLCVLCFFCFPKLLIYQGEIYQQAERRGSWTRIESLMYATGGQAFSRPSPF